MRIELIRRPERSKAMSWLSPVIAVLLTLLAGAFIFAASGIDPLQGLYVYFIEPLTLPFTLYELVVKAIPIVTIAVGLALCYLSNTWNIGAEGQLTVGAICGSLVPILLPDFQTVFTLPLMLVMGILGGALYAAIPALLKTRFGTNEILTSLMLVYVATYLLDWLVRGPLRDPKGFGFPGSRSFTDFQVMPILFPGSRVHLGLIIALVVVVGGWFVLRKTITGFAITTIGQAPRAGAFAGFSQNKMVLLTFLISGALAGLAGISEVAGPIGQLRTTVSPGYGFTAIIVAFLGRLNPIGAIFAGFLLALSYLGGEGAQIALGMSDQTTRVFQGMLLFFVLACDSFIFYRLQIVRRPVTHTQAVAS
ncbi:MAG: ABC transporter permease [Rhizobiales bacterium]|nr:ABC transporter permease [Hyphomicrobiales bacterium]